MGHMNTKCLINDTCIHIEEHIISADFTVKIQLYLLSVINIINEWHKKIVILDNFQHWDIHAIKKVLVIVTHLMYDYLSVLIKH